MVYFDGKFIPEKEALISINAPGFLSGFGIFETMRYISGKKIVYFRQHIARLKESCRVIKMPFPYSHLAIERNIARLVKLNSLDDANLRITVYRAEILSSTVITAKKYQPYSARVYRRGFSAAICPFKDTESSFLRRLKTTNRIFFELALQEARQRGFDEAVILNSRGNIAEGSRTNIFFIKEQEIFTPALSGGCLDGITRKAVIDSSRACGFSTYEGNFTLKDLQDADEAFLTNSLIGVMPLTRLERKNIGTGSIGKNTAFLMERYRSLLNKDEP